jgi:hypothetical protein
MAQQEPLECTVELRGDIYVTVDPGGSCHPTTGWELYLWQAAEQRERHTLSRLGLLRGLLLEALPAIGNLRGSSSIAPLLARIRTALREST